MEPVSIYANGTHAAPEVEHVILVAFSVPATSRRAAQKTLVRALPRTDEGHIDSWWIAEDDRIDGSDNDSAVFVPAGQQYNVSRSLFINGMTEHYNMVERPDSIFEARW